ALCAVASAARTSMAIAAATVGQALTSVRRVRKEQLLAADLVRGDRLLPCRREHPVGERLRELHLDVRVLRRIDDDDAVLVEEALVALDQDREIAAILEAQPGAAVGQRVGVRLR